MSLEDQYDAWVRGLMGGKKYAATSKQAEDASNAVEQMQASLDALTAAQKRQSAASNALDAVQKAGAATAESVRKMSSELTKSLHQDGLLGGTTAAPTPEAAKPASTDFGGVADKIKAQVLGQDAFVSALVKAFRRPFVLGTADDTTHARSVMLLCGPNGTGRHYALQCVVDELAARGVLHSAAVETLDLALYPGPAQEKLFLQDLYAALQSDAEVLAFEHYESCAANYLNMLATLAMDASASPRKPSVWICPRSSAVAILLVAWRINALSIYSASIPEPLSTICSCWMPPRTADSVICVAPASMAFSSSSFATEAGRSTTSPAAISSAVCLSSTRISAMVFTCL